MSGWKRALRAVVMLALALISYFVVPVDTKGEDLLIRVVVSFIALGLLTAGIVWQVILHVDDPNRQIDGLVLALVIAVLAFALAFYRLAIGYPGQMADLETRVDALYFTVSTLLTVGFGDVHAVGQAARVLVLVAMVFNVVVIATAATTLTGRVRMHAEQRAEARRIAEGSGSSPERVHHRRRTHRNPR
jgi:voltage-gated potassium channel